jgi:hypothetical protein
VRVSITERGRQRYAAAAAGVTDAVARLPTPSGEQVELIRAHLLDLLEAVDRAVP